ncbi:MAG: glycoside hydrolase family 43 protein [Clostridia bacterium]
MINNTVWKDSNDNLIQSHGGCVLKVDDTYFWYGENKDAKMKGDRVDFLGFNCYSSKDLKSFKFEGLVFDVKKTSATEISVDAVGERPKVVFNKKTNKFVMWFHLDDKTYHFAKIGIATCDTPNGNFVYHGYLHALARFDMRVDTRDLTLFQDGDEAFLVASCNWNSSMLIAKLSDDYLDLNGEFKIVLKEQFREAPVVIKENGKYFMFSSGCSGWEPNATLYAIADQMFGAWKLVDNPCVGDGARQSFGCQTAFALKIDQQWFIAFDKWNPKDLKMSGYTFLPLQISENSAEIQWADTFEANR